MVTRHHIHPGPSIQQQPDDCPMPTTYGEVQRRVTVPVNYIHIGTVVNQPLAGLGIPAVSSTQELAGL